MIYAGIGIVIGMIALGLWMPSTTLHHGEKVVKKRLDHLRRSHFRSRHGVLLKVQKGFTEIDHIVVGRGCIYVIETKYAHGTIAGDVNAKLWQQTLGSKTHTMRNPLWQNQKHVQILAKQLHRPLSEFENIVVFPDDAKILIKDQRLVKVSTVVSRINQTGPLRKADRAVDQAIGTLNYASALNRWRHRKAIEATRKRNRN